MEKSIECADIVCSLAGRDAGRLFLVLKTEENYAYLIDGKLRKLQRPKRKKQKHLRRVSGSDSPVAQRIKSGGTVSDKEIRIALAEFEAKSQCGQLDRGGK